jgi:hypothetical protein
MMNDYGAMWKGYRANKDTIHHINSGNKKEKDHDIQHLNICGPTIVIRVFANSQWFKNRNQKGGKFKLLFRNRKSNKMVCFIQRI